MYTPETLKALAEEPQIRGTGSAARLRAHANAWQARETELIEALMDAEFLLHKLSINWLEAASMVDSMKRIAEAARATIKKV